MARVRNPFVFIPIVLTVAVLVIAPKAITEHEATGVFIVLMAIGFPWLLFFIISRAVQHAIEQSRKSSQAEENHDFV